MPEKKYKLFYKIIVALTKFDVKRLEKISKALHLKAALTRKKPRTAKQKAATKKMIAANKRRR